MVQHVTWREMDLLHEPALLWSRHGHCPLHHSIENKTIVNHGKADTY